MFQVKETCCLGDPYRRITCLRGARQPDNSVNRKHHKQTNKHTRTVNVAGIRYFPSAAGTCANMQDYKGGMRLTTRTTTVTEELTVSKLVKTDSSLESEALLPSSTKTWKWTQMDPINIYLQVPECNVIRVHSVRQTDDTVFHPTRAISWVKYCTCLNLFLSKTQIIRPMLLNVCDSLRLNFDSSVASYGLLMSTSASLPNVFSIIQ